MKPFPTSDINKIYEDFRTKFLELPDEEANFYEDFRNYCVNIARALSYVLADKTNKIPQGQIDMLYQSFFEGSTANYPYFFQEYQTFEQARILLLKMLSNNLYPFNGHPKKHPRG